MPEPVIENNASAELGADQIACAKCGTINSKKGRRCLECGSHLYWRCNDCRTRNARGLESCTACGKLRHPSLLTRIKHRLKSKSVQHFFRKSRLLLSVVLLLAIALICLYFLMNASAPVAPGVSTDH